MTCSNGCARRYARPSDSSRSNMRSVRLVRSERRWRRLTPGGSSSSCWSSARHRRPPRARQALQHHQLARSALSTRARPQQSFLRRTRSWTRCHRRQRRAQVHGRGPQTWPSSWHVRKSVPSSCTHVLWRRQRHARRRRSCGRSYMRPSTAGTTRSFGSWSCASTPSCTSTTSPQHPSNCSLTFARRARWHATRVRCLVYVARCRLMRCRTRSICIARLVAIGCS